MRNPTSKEIDEVTPLVKDLDNFDLEFAKIEAAKKAKVAEWVAAMATLKRACGVPVDCDLCPTSFKWYNTKHEQTGQITRTLIKVDE